MSNNPTPASKAAETKPYEQSLPVSGPVLGELRDSFAVQLSQDARLEHELWASTRPDPFKG